MEQTGLSDVQYLHDSRTATHVRLTPSPYLWTRAKPYPVGRPSATMTNTTHVHTRWVMACCTTTEEAENHLDNSMWNPECSTSAGHP